MHTKEFYDEKRKEFEKASTIKELKCFLNSVTASYDEVYHFTDFNALKGIIENRKWKFNPLDRMNDKLEPEKETGDWENRISVSFSHGDEDNIGMWKMYGEDSIKDEFNTSLCITLPQAFFRLWSERIRKNQEELKSFFVYEATGEPIAQEDKRPIEVFCHDMVYYYGYKKDENAQLVWDNNLKEMKTEDLKRIIDGSASDLIGYIKNSAWEYERESRISIVAPEGYMIDPNKKDFFVSIDDDAFNLMMQEIRIRLSPFSFIDNDLYYCFIRKLKRIFKDNNIECTYNHKRRCSLSFFKGKVFGKDSSKACYRKRKDNLPDKDHH